MRHARPRRQVRLERVLYVLALIAVGACLFVAMTSVDPEIVSRSLG